MAQFNKDKTEKLFLPSTKDLPEAERAWVVLRTHLTLEDSVASSDEPTLEKAGKLILLRMLKEWNYTSADGKPIEISSETIGWLDKVDSDYLSNYIINLRESQQEGLSDEEKKDSSASSTPASTVTPPPSTPQPAI